MLNLFDYLTELDNKRIENYIHLYGIEDDYIGNKAYLKYWAENNKKLFHLLGGKLIHKIPFKCEKPKEAIEKELAALYESYDEKLFYPIYNTLKDMEKNTSSEDAIHFIIFCQEIFWMRAKNYLIKDAIIDGIKYKNPEKKNVIQLPAKMKPVRAMQKIINYLDELQEYKDKFEEFRIAHSVIFNEKELKGNLCFSIHPLDFMTMSDNDSGWSSCMSWKGDGCYHVGTVEMMNSNNVICCYLENSKPFLFDNAKENKRKDDEFIWNNKKWRQLMYINKDIIMCGKAYPYNNDVLALAALEEVKKLAAAINWTYTFGPEKYQDMKHIDTLYKMERNREWLWSGNTTKHNIIFDTNGMYNDMFADNSRPYWCYRNKVKKMKYISVSGKAPCLCCGDPVLEEADPYEYDEYDEYGYHDRYVNAGRVICPRCISNRYCEICCNESGYSATIEINGEFYCKSCVKEYFRKCPDCGKAFHFYHWDIMSKMPFIRLADEDFSVSEYGEADRSTNKYNYKDKLARFMCCKECLEKYESQIEKIHIKNSQFEWNSRIVNRFAKIYNINDEFVQSHLAVNTEYIDF